jgi:peptidoglycan hydrolase-like protein with peptidoglycan-binding domain
VTARPIDDTTTGDEHMTTTDETDATEMPDAPHAPAPATTLEAGRTPRRSRRKVVAAGVVAAVAAAAVAVTVPHRGGGHARAAPKQTTTAAVERRDLVNREQVNGTLGYAPLPATLAAARAGVLTTVAAEGAVVDRGQALYGLDGTPVLLLFGSTPAYRDLVEGMAGPDVRQLKENLVALGDATWAGIGDDDVFGSAAAAALRRFQAAAGVEATGIIRQGDAVFLPGAVRIASHKVEAGTSLSAGAEVASITSAARVVTVKLAATKQGLVHLGDGVVVVLPSGKSTDGKVAAISSVAKTDSSGGGGGGNGSAKPTVDVTISLSDPAATGTTDQAPVQVAITTASVKGVLAVPVNALLALAEGGYGVEAVRADGTHALVPVETGMFSDSDNLVEVTGELKVGDKVVVSA